MSLRSNMSFDADTHQQSAARRVDKPTPCGALRARAGQLRRWASVNTLRRIVLASQATAMALLLVACAAPGVPLSTLLESAVGKPLSATRVGQTASDMRLVSDSGSEREYERQLANGCAYAITVNTATAEVLHWRFTSSPSICEQVRTHPALGS